MRGAIMDDWKLDRIGSCERGENPTLLAKMKSGFAVIADSQFLPGYCILLASPKITSLNELPIEARSQFLLDMSMIGDAIMKTCNPLRLNYSIMANTDHYLHAHIQARYDWEADNYIRIPAWSYPVEEFYGKAHEFDEVKHSELKGNLIKNLNVLIEQAGSNYLR